METELFSFALRVPKIAFILWTLHYPLYVQIHINDLAPFPKHFKAAHINAEYLKTEHRRNQRNFSASNIF